MTYACKSRQHSDITQLQIHLMILFTLFLIPLLIPTFSSAAEITGEIDPDIVVTEEDLFAYPYTDDLNVRSGPGTSYPVIGEILINEKVHITGRNDETGWYRVEIDGNEGFACGFLMRLTGSGNEGGNSEQDLHHLIKAEGNVPQDRLDAFNERLSMVPDYLLQAFADTGWEIYLTEYDVGTKYGEGKYGRLQGITMYDRKVIYLDNRDVVIDAVLHEFGHFADYYLGFPSETEEFAPIYRNADEFNSYFNFTNGVYNEKEVFAEMFFDYLVRPDEMKKICPEAYLFLEWTL